MPPVWRVCCAMWVVSLLTALVLTGCGGTARDQAISQVRPSIAAAGDMVLVLGRGFDRGDIVWIHDRPAARVTWVNDGLLTAVVPEGLPAGAYQLEVRSADGGRVVAAVNVSAPPPAHPSAAAQPAAPPTAPATHPPAAAQPAAPPLPAVQPVQRPAGTPPRQAAPPAQVNEKDKERREKEREKEKERREKERDKDDDG